MTQFGTKVKIFSKEILPLKNCLRLLLILSAVFTFGCGPGFQLLESSQSESSEVSGTKTDKNILKTEQGQLNWKSSSPEGTKKTISFELKVPYGRVFSVLSPALRIATPWSCQLISEIKSNHPLAYEKGEVPCGKIVSDEWKELLRVETPAYSIDSSGYKVSVSSTIAPIFVHRGARTGKYSESSLDTKSLVERTSSAAFGEDISLKYRPNNTGVTLGLCVNVPGQVIRSSSLRVTGKAKANVWGFKPSYVSDFTLEPGFATFDFARTCVDVGVQIDGLLPTVDAVVTEAPYVSNATYQGLKIKINDWFLRFLDDVFGVFRASFRKELQKMATNEVNKYLDTDIETGKWFTKVHGPKLVENTAQNANKKIHKAFENLGIALTAAQLKQKAFQFCEIREIAGGPAWSDRIQTVCRDLLDKVTFVIHPFKVDQEMQNKGCYDHYARIHDWKSASGDKKWWAAECQFQSYFSVEFPTDFSEYENDLTELLADLIYEIKLPDSWKDELVRYGVDESSAQEIIAQSLLDGNQMVSISDFQVAIEKYLNLL